MVKSVTTGGTANIQPRIYIKEKNEKNMITHIKPLNGIIETDIEQAKILGKLYIYN